MQADGTTPSTPSGQPLLPMSWDYVAAFFDGEGSVGFYGPENHRQRRISWANTQRDVLEEMQRFMGTGYIYASRRIEPNLTVYSLVISRIDDLKQVIPDLLPRCRIKGPKLIELLSEMEGRKGKPKQEGPYVRLDEETVLRLYRDGRLSLDEVAERVGVTPSAVQHFMARHGIERRRVGERGGVLAQLGPEGLRHLYVDKGLNSIQIGERLGVTAKSVVAALSRYGIPRRPRGTRRLVP